ncbi:TPA: hypothetical protein N0F65_008934 [Lagenidium giganteum]|uniref:ODAD1 central coiled coil region domain-containing protein n=1 Tax=Lagenidium giganteum TaxID=4803 RepID=A0AAV2Z0H8_9STRA|nr:TPA: hypothetical protein N0F65_008934 [Lagenidium giganteum]
MQRASSDSVIKKKQQGSLLDQELLLLERDDGRRHSKELSDCLHEYAKKIEDVQAKNRRLEEELSFDDQLARDDPYFNDVVAEKLSDLYLQGNNVMIRLELERKEVLRLNRLIQRHESQLAQQKAKLYELAALDHNHMQLIARVRKMENDIDRRIVKLNEKLNQNRKLRDQIDAHRAERSRMDAIYSKIAAEALSKKQKVDRVAAEIEKLREEVAEVEQEIEAVRQDGETWEKKCDDRATELLHELKELALHHKEADEPVDIDKYKHLGENDMMKSVSDSHENVLRTRVTRGRWKTGQAKIATDVLLTKYQENRTFIEKIHELAEDIENHRQISAKLREEIGRLKQRKDSVDIQRMNRIEALKSRLQFTIDQKKHKEEANHELQSFLTALKPAILQMHSRIGCPELHNSDVKKILGDIEEQTVNVLQRYHAKLEAKRLEEEKEREEAAAAEALANAKNDPRAKSASGRRTLTGRHKTDTDANESQAATTGEAAATAAAPPAVPSPPFAAANAVESKAPTLKSITAVLSKEQPYRYAGLKPPHLSMEELKRKDNVEEEYPLTYDELKNKVWRTDTH